MNWTNITNEEELSQALALSDTHPILIFKHSTRCMISSTALSRLERTWKSEEVAPLKPYFLDLISFRNLSNKIAQELKVPHESPQVLVVNKGKAVYDTSHMGINFGEIKDLMATAP